MHSKDEEDFKALIAEEMPELEAIWFRFYSREPDDLADAGGFIARFTLMDSVVEESSDTDLEFSTLKRIDRVVSDHYDMGRCGHAHDCCGCMFLQSVNVVKRYSSVYVEVNFGLNY